MNGLERNGLNYPDNRQLISFDQQVEALESRVDYLTQRVLNMRTFDIGDLWVTRINSIGKFSFGTILLTGVGCCARAFLIQMLRK